jgi:hypothetical protein
MVTIEELKSGARPRISEREFAQLRGCSVATVQKDRVKGKGAPFLKDPVTGRVSYAADAALAFLDRAVPCRSTGDYDTSAHQSRLDKARETLANSRLSLDGAA